VLELANPGGFVIIPVAPSKYEDSPFCGYEVKLSWAAAPPKIAHSARRAGYLNCFDTRGSGL
jgi:hypothetical protein